MRPISALFAYGSMTYCIYCRFSCVRSKLLLNWCNQRSGYWSYRLICLCMRTNIACHKMTWFFNKTHTYIYAYSSICIFKMNSATEWFKTDCHSDSILLRKRVIINSKLRKHYRIKSLPYKRVLKYFINFPLKHWNTKKETLFSHIKVLNWDNKKNLKI